MKWLKLFEKFENCPIFPLTDEIINYISNFNTDEELLRSGGLPINMLDRMAFGFSPEDIKQLSPSQLSIKWKNDLENVKWELKKSGFFPVVWAQKIRLTEPIDVSYKSNKFWVEDGHHRYYAAKILNKPLNVNLEIKENPIVKLSDLNYDDFHRCIFKQVKNNI